MRTPPTFIALLVLSIPAVAGAADAKLQAQLDEARSLIKMGDYQRADAALSAAIQRVESAKQLKQGSKAASEFPDLAQEQTVFLYGAFTKLRLNDEDGGFSLAARAVQVRSIVWGASWTDYTERFERELSSLVATRSERERAQALVLMGNVWYRSGEMERGASRVRLATTVDATYVTPRYVLGEMYARAGRIADAAEEFRLAADLSPTDLQLLNDAAASLSMAGREKEALPYLERATHLDPSDAKTQVNLAMTLYALRDPGALRAIDDGLTRFPDLRQLFQTARLYVQLDTGDAQEAMRTSDDLGNDLHGVQVALRIIALEKVGRSDDARREMARLKQENPAVLDETFLRANWSLRRDLYTTFVEVRDAKAPSSHQQIPRTQTEP